MDIRNKIKELKKELEKLRQITSKRFETSEELKNYVTENIESYNKAKEVQEEIEKLKWKLLSPKEKEEKEEQKRLSKLKREGKLI